MLEDIIRVMWHAMDDDSKRYAREDLTPEQRVELDKVLPIKLKVKDIVVNLQT